MCLANKSQVHMPHTQSSKIFRQLDNKSMLRGSKRIGPKDMACNLNSLHSKHSHLNMVHTLSQQYSNKSLLHMLYNSHYPLNLQFRHLGMRHTKKVHVLLQSGHGDKTTSSRLGWSVDITEDASIAFLLACCTRIVAKVLAAFRTSETLRVNYAMVLPERKLSKSG